MLRLLPLFLLIFSFSFCKVSPEKVSEYSKGKIHFGSIGGFAGAYNEYILLRNGQLFQVAKIGSSPVEINSVSSQLTTQVFNSLKLFGLDTLKYQKPDNLYYFLKYENGKVNNMITWSGKPDQNTQSVSSLYKILISQTKNLKK